MSNAIVVFRKGDNRQYPTPTWATDIEYLAGCAVEVRDAPRYRRSIALLAQPCGAINPGPLPHSRTMPSGYA